MFWLIVLLLFIGIILIILEAVVPHGLSVIAGVGVIAVSVYLCFKSYGMQLGTIYLVISLLLSFSAAFVMFKSSIRFLALHPWDEREREAGEPKPAEATEPLLGEWLRVTQPLRPTGTVEWRGRRYPARSLRPELEIPVGARVRLHDHDSVYLLVDLGEDDGKMTKVS